MHKTVFMAALCIFLLSGSVWASDKNNFLVVGHVEAIVQAPPSFAIAAITCQAPYGQPTMHLRIACDSFFMDAASFAACYTAAPGDCVQINSFMFSIDPTAFPTAKAKDFIHVGYCTPL
jgi:hypothetical protein